MNDATAILPAALVCMDSRAVRIWTLCRSLDHPINGGEGEGKIKISLKELCYWLRRTERSVWRYVKAAVSKEFFHSCKFTDGVFTVKYASFRRLAKQFKLPSLGAIGQFPLIEIQNAAARSADIMADRIQRQSDYARKHTPENREPGAVPKKGLKASIKKLQKSASELLAATSAKVPGVAAIGKRLIYLDRSQIPFGASQKSIAHQLGCSVRTVQYRLSDQWRRERGLSPILKRQTAYLEAEGYNQQLFNELLEWDSEPNRLVRLGRRVFRVGTNIYEPDTCLRVARYRMSEYNEDVVSEVTARGMLHEGYSSLDQDLEKSPFVRY
jgi:hypothetical protein